MALEKLVVIDKIEILEDGQMQIRQATKIMEDGKEIGKIFHRHCLAPGQKIDKESLRTQIIALAIWTPAVIASYKEKLEK